MQKKYNLIDNLTAFIILVMTFIVVFIIFVAQRENVDLSHESLILFIIGFCGSILCIIIRFGILYYIAFQQINLLIKAGSILYFTLWTILATVNLILVLQNSHFSLKHSALSGYNDYQIFMLVLLMAQWSGEKIFGL